MEEEKELTRFEQSLVHAEDKATFYYLEQDLCEVCDDVQGYWLSLAEMIGHASEPMTW